MNKIALIIACSLLSTSLILAQDWVHVLEGAQSTSANQIITLPNGDFMVGGQVNDPGDYYLLSGLLVRYSHDGDLIWQKRIGSTTPDGAYFKNERFDEIVLSSDGYILAVGSRTPNQPNSYAASDLFVAKMDLDGNVIWRKYFNWGFTDNGFGITALPNGEAIICGNTNSYNNGNDLDGYLMKINANGESLWVKTYDHQGAEDWLYGVIITENQQIMAIGTSQNQIVGNRTWALKTDLDGTEIWQKTYADYSIKGVSIVANKQGNFGICGQGFGSSTSFDNLLMEIDGNGKEIWGDHYFSPGPQPVPDELFDILPCNEGGYVAVGMSGTEAFDGYYIIRIDADGDTLKTDHLFDGPPASEYATSITWTLDGALMATGGRIKPGGDYDLLLTRLEGYGCTQLNTSGIKEQVFVEVGITPNPATDFILVNAESLAAGTYHFSIMDASGSLITNLLSNQSTFSIPCQAFPSGVYFYALELSDGRLATGKLTIQH